MRTVRFLDNRVVIIDQTKLPHSFVELSLENSDQVAQTIKDMKVRGAPAIGITAAYGMALAAQEYAGERGGMLEHLKTAYNKLLSTRPTAVNLRWALDSMLETAETTPEDKMCEVLLRQAEEMAEKDIAINRAIGQYGAQVIAQGSSVLTHCNAGSLATVGFGTALGVIRTAFAEGKIERIYATETRPRQQGARLTTWELTEEGYPVTLIADTAAGWVIKTGKVNTVIVGADRITRNGDTANKIGTYTLAVVAKENGIDFFVAAPTSTIDETVVHGFEIPIEERAPEEVTVINGGRIAPAGVDVFNPAFDVTPARYITGIITEYGVIRPPYRKHIPEVLTRAGGKERR